jgi:hypothetical protein
MRYLGIDPGINGHIVLLQDRYKVLLSEPIPVVHIGKGRVLDVRALYDLLNHVRISYGGDVVAGLERVGPTMGIKAMFNFGGVYFATQMALTACGIPFEFVEPKVWLRHFTLAGSDKDKSRVVAGNLFPAESFKLKKDIDRAEATLIARYVADTHKPLGRRRV